jgi:hypothetical protein
VSGFEVFAENMTPISDKEFIISDGEVVVHMSDKPDSKVGHFHDIFNGKLFRQIHHYGNHVAVFSNFAPVKIFNVSQGESMRIKINGAETEGV